MRGRNLTAWWTAIVVLSSYLWVRLLAPIRGSAWEREALVERHVRNAQRVQRAIVRLKGLFIKVGQLLSIVANVLPEEFRHGLEGLQDAVPPSDPEHVARRFREELGRTPSEVFAEFAPQPIASASLGQVHLARLHDGRAVAVKVQHPDIERIAHHDLRTLRRILRFVGLFFPSQGLMNVYDEVRTMILAELDFEEEARNLERIARNHTSSKDILVPAVHRAHSTRRILTTDWVDGTKVTNVAELAARGVDPRQLASRLVHAFCEQIFEHGVYHADPHPGNILVTPDGRIALVDFGAVAELSPTMREGIVQFLHGVLAADTDRICASLQTMGFVNRGAGSAEVLERVVAHFHERFTRSVRVESLHLRDVRVDPAEALDALLDLRRMDIGLRELGEAFHVPREWVLLERTLLLLMGLCTTLDPELRPMALVRPYVERLVLGDRDYTAFAVETAREVGLQYLTLPAEVKRLVVAANRGRLELRSRDVRDATRTVYALGHQVIWAAFTITSVVLAAVFRIEGDAESASTASLTAWGFGALLAISMVRHRLRRGGS